MSTPVITPPADGKTPLQVLEQGAEDVKDPKVQPEVKEEPEGETSDTSTEDELDDLDDSEELASDELPEDEEIALPGRIDFKEVKKTFPELLKKFPQLQANYYKAEQYTEIFPSVEDARAGSQKAEVFDIINNQVLQGDISLILNAVEAEAPKSLNRIAETILPDLYKKDPQLYSAAMAPEIKKLVISAIRAGEKSGNENLKNAALVLQEYVFGANGLPADKAPVQEDPEKQQLKNQAATLFLQQAHSYENDVKDFTAKHLVKSIEDGLDPDGTMSDFVKGKLVEQIVDDVNSNLMKNGTITKEMNSLWLKAAQKGFSAEMKPVIARAFLARAKLILPAIKQKRRAEVFGKKEVKMDNGPRKTNIRQSSGPTKVSSPVVSKTEIRKEGLSPMDVIMRGAS
jgi:ribosomal protein L22